MTATATARRRRVSTRLARRALSVSWFAWLAVGVMGIVFLQLAGSAGCEHETGDSNFGESSWSLVPFGHVCTWTLEGNGVDDRQGPTPVWSLWLVGVASGLPALAVLRRREQDLTSDRDQGGQSATNGA